MNNPETNVSSSAWNDHIKPWLLICILLPPTLVLMLCKPLYLLAESLYYTVVNVVFPTGYRKIQLDRLRYTLKEFDAKHFWVDGVGYCSKWALRNDLKDLEDIHLLYLNNKLKSLCPCARNRQVLFINSYQCTCELERKLDLSIREVKNALRINCTNQ